MPNSGNLAADYKCLPAIPTGVQAAQQHLKAVSSAPANAAAPSHDGSGGAGPPTPSAPNGHRRRVCSQVSFSAKHARPQGVLGVCQEGHAVPASSLAASCHANRQSKPSRGKLPAAANQTQWHCPCMGSHMLCIHFTLLWCGSGLSVHAITQG